MAKIEKPFLVAISSGDVRIEAQLPESVDLNIEQEWENPFKLEINPALKAAFEFFTGKLGGRKSLIWDHNLLYTYMGGSPLTFSLQIEFVAEDSVQAQIVDPIKKLMKLSSPSSGGDLINGRLKAMLNAPPKVSISIGNMLYVQEAIITQVQPPLGRPLVSGDDGDFQGAPARVPVQITIQTLRIMTQERVDEYFFSDGAQGLQ